MEVYKVVHGKVYSGLAEEIYRFGIYQENVAYITMHNYFANLGHHSYYLKMNHLGDLLHTEYIAMNGLHMDERENKTLESAATFIAPRDFVAPSEVHWRTKGSSNRGIRSGTMWRVLGLFCNWIP